jgi:hypothetical protein
MKSRTFWPVMALLLFYVTVASAQHPILDMVANKAVQKYQTGSCERGGKRNHKKGSFTAASSNS